jgi:arginase
MTNQFILTPFFLDQPLREMEALAYPGWILNKTPLPEGELQPRLSALHQPLAKLVAQTMASGQRPVSLAGDCCTALAVLAGLQRAGCQPRLIWFDAHGDFNTWETSPSGFIGGMPLAMLVGRGDQTLVNAVYLRPLPESQVILTDARDLDPQEEQALAASKVRHYPDCRTLLEEVLLGSAKSTGPLYIHFDVDVINPKDAPAMSYSALGGPAAMELKPLFHALAQTGQIVAVSMATWNPKLDRDGGSQETCLDLLNALIG